MRRDAFVRASGPRVARRAVLTAGLGFFLLWLFAQRLQTVHPAEVLVAMGQVGLRDWVLAALATAVSFHAVAGYDLTQHRHLATGVAPPRARLAGIAAIAIGQTVGLGVLSGALVRWRLMPDLGLFGAMRLSVAVALSFLPVWAVLVSVALLAWPVPAFAGGPWLGLGGVVGGLDAGLALRRAWCPNLITVTRLLMLAAVDCTAAGLSLWLLLPGDLALAVFAPAFLIALGAGLMSGAPAGLGAFEMVLLALLPKGAPAGLLAGVVAWRMLGHALPALARRAGLVVLPVAQEAWLSPLTFRLDLLRPDPDAPEGTAQLMVATAIAAARDLGVQRLSLAAVLIGGHFPPPKAGERRTNGHGGGPVAWLGRRLAPKAMGKAMGGLCQFEGSFAPDWQRLYVAGPSRPVLGLVGLEILRQVHCPPPLANMSRSAGHDAEYGFASGRNPWQRKGDQAA